MTSIFNAVVVITCAAYVLLLLHRHPPGPLWIAPPLAAVLGSAFTQQLAAGRIAREAMR